MLSIETIRRGERVAVWGPEGELQLVDGPRRLLIWRRRVEPLVRHTAGPTEYLAVKYTDGHEENVRGPAAVWFHPVLHDSLRTHPGVQVSGNEAVVVYRQEDGRVTRRVERGPTLFVPAAGEWLHEFSWHGAVQGSPNRRKSPHALKFTKLWVIPDQMYHDVDDVRTNDDALLTLQLMIFFELVDIETMLDQTHDPIADIVNAVSADVIDFAAAHSFEDFKDHTDRLNDLATYDHLCQRAARIGYRINKVVYRGYRATESLQTMHNQAIEARTQLRLAAETERQTEALADMKLERQRARTIVKHDMERQDAEHRAGLEDSAHEAQLARDQSEFEARLTHRRQRWQEELAHGESLDRQRVALLSAIGGLQVDLTRYLVAQEQGADKLVRIETADRPRVHIHEK